MTAPVASIELPPVTETTAPETADPDPDTTVATDAPVPTEAPAPSTTEPPPTTAAPPATDARPADVFFRVGDDGPVVSSMQRRLAILDYLPDGSDDGVFDEATERGLRSFQADYGLGVDGVFGPITDRALNAAAQSVAVDG